MNNIILSFLVCDFRKKFETQNCLQSIKKHALLPHCTIYLDNGASDENYPNDFYQQELCDIIIRKRRGMGAGFGQTDLIRFCSTKYFIFVENDQELIQDITQDRLNYFIDLLENKGFHCIDLNGDQSNKDAWTNRAHLMKTSFFNSFAPFPNGGPGYDSLPWNEEFLSHKFRDNNYKIAHIRPLFFKDCGKWSIREAGDGLYKHRTDTKILFIEKTPTYKTDVFPPFDTEDWELALSGNWPKDGKVPNLWKNNVFKCWSD